MFLSYTPCDVSSQKYGVSFFDLPLMRKTPRSQTVTNRDNIIPRCPSKQFYRLARRNRSRRRACPFSTRTASPKKRQRSAKSGYSLIRFSPRAARLIKRLLPFEGSKQEALGGIWYICISRGRWTSRTRRARHNRATVWIVADPPAAGRACVRKFLGKKAKRRHGCPIPVYHKFRFIVICAILVRRRKLSACICIRHTRARWIILTIVIVTLSTR